MFSHVFCYLCHLWRQHVWILDFRKVQCTRRLMSYTVPIRHAHQIATCRGSCSAGTCPLTHSMCVCISLILLTENIVPRYNLNQNMPDTCCLGQAIPASKKPYKRCGELENDVAAAHFLHGPCTYITVEAHVRIPPTNGSARIIISYLFLAAYPRVPLKT